MSAEHPADYRLLIERQARQDFRRLGYLMVLALGALLLSLCAGERWIWPSAWFGESLEQVFVWQLRLPRALAVMTVGASLAMAGAVMQTIFANPLAEPGLLGVSSGAGVAVTLAVLASHGVMPSWGLGLCAVAGSMAITALLLALNRRRASNARLLLTGVALGIVCSAVMTWAIYYSSSLDLRQLMYWMMGGFGGVDWRAKWLLLSLLPFILWLCLQGRVLNLLILGELQARQLGLSVHVWRNLFVVAFGWMVGISVALAGVVSFIGLVVPHLLSLWGLTDKRRLLPGCALAGASLLLLADILARTALDAAELPVGVVTATLGSPVFIWLLTKAKGYS